MKKVRSVIISFIEIGKEILYDCTHG